MTRNPLAASSDDSANPMAPIGIQKAVQQQALPAGSAELQRRRSDRSAASLSSFSAHMHPVEDQQSALYHQALHPRSVMSGQASSKNAERDLTNEDSFANLNDDPEARSDTTQGLDPLGRVLFNPLPSALSPFMQAREHDRRDHPGASAFQSAVAVPALPPLETLVDRFVRRFALSGDRHRGVAHLEIGAGELAGASLTITTEHGTVRLVLDAPSGVDVSLWKEALTKRLQQRGVDVEVEVR